MAKKKVGEAVKSEADNGPEAFLRRSVAAWRQGGGRAGATKARGTQRCRRQPGDGLVGGGNGRWGREREREREREVERQRRTARGGDVERDRATQ